MAQTHLDFHWPVYLYICVLTIYNMQYMYGIHLYNRNQRHSYNIYQSIHLALRLSVFDLSPDHRIPYTETNLATQVKARIFPALQKIQITHTLLYVHVKYKNNSKQTKMSIQMPGER